MNAPKRFRSKPWVISALVVVLAGCGHVSTASRSISNGRSVSSCPRHVSLVPFTTRKLQRGVGAIVTEGGRIFVANPVAGTVTRINGSSSVAVRLAPGPMSLATYDGRLWVAERDANEVISLSTQNLHRLTTSRLPVPVGVVAGPFGVWALSMDTAALYQINPATGMNFAPRDSPASGPTEMAAAGEELWVLGAGEQGLSPFNAKLGRIVRAGYRLAGESMGGLSANNTGVWLGEPRALSILHVNLGATRIEEISAPGRMAVTSTAVGQCGVWVASSAGKLGLVASGSGASLTSPIRVSSTIAAIATSERDAWVTDPLSGTITRVRVQEV